MNIPLNETDQLIHDIVFSRDSSKEKIYLLVDIEQKILNKKELTAKSWGTLSVLNMSIQHILDMENDNEAL